MTAFPARDLALVGQSRRTALRTLLGGPGLGVKRLLLVLAAGACIGAAPPPERVSIQVIHAKTTGTEVDPRLERLAKELQALKKEFTSFVLKDQTAFSLNVGATARMQLPNGEWLVVHAQELTADGDLRLELEVKKIEFKATAKVKKGATLAVAGPPFDGGRLILAVSRVPESSKP